VKNSNYPIGNRTRVLPACSTMPPVPEVLITEKCSKGEDLDREQHGTALTYI
jgi:hypothetical protein